MNPELVKVLGGWIGERQGKRIMQPSEFVIRPSGEVAASMYAQPSSAAWTLKRCCGLSNPAWTSSYVSVGDDAVVELNGPQVTGGVSVTTQGQNIFRSAQGGK